MKLCFVDESGLHEEADVLVAVGLIVDAYRLRSSEQDLHGIFEALGDRTGVVGEIKASQIYRGKGPWRHVEPEIRRQAFRELCGWSRDRSHRLALGAVRKDAFREARLDSNLSDWMHVSAHVLLQIQSAHQRLQRNKGNTVFVFDEQVRNSRAMQNLVEDPPAWVLDYPGLAADDPLDQVIATPFWTQSDIVGFVQIADVYAYIFRRYAEIIDCGASETFDGELAFVQDCIDMLSPRLLAPQARHPSRGATSTSDWFRQTAPPSLVGL